MKPSPDPHYRHRFPAEIISHAVWLYHVFSLSLRDVELLLVERGVVVSYDVARSSVPASQTALPPGVQVSSGGELHYLGGVYVVVLDILVQGRRDTKAAKRFFKRLLRGLEYVPRVIVTDKLRSYGAAKREVFPDVEHRQSRYLNNRAENSHRPTRQRERQRQHFKSARQAQRFLSTPSFIYGHFRPRRHLIAARQYRAIRARAFKVWQQETCVRKAV